MNKFHEVKKIRLRTNDRKSDEKYGKNIIGKLYDKLLSEGIGPGYEMTEHLLRILFSCTFAVMEEEIESFKYNKDEREKYIEKICNLIKINMLNKKLN